MTQSLFDAAENVATLDRLRAITPETPVEWGKMDAAQMMAHCSVGLGVAMGELKFKRGLIGYLLGGLAKRSMIGPKPFGRNMPTSPDFRIADPRELEVERTKLIELCERFTAGGPAVLTPDQHPFFGKMTSDEWDGLMWKHLDHHLRQFGV